MKKAVAPDPMTIVRFGTAVFDFIDARYITRRIMTLGTFYIVIRVVDWSLTFAQTSPRSGVDIAAILAAIMMPLNGLMGYMFAQYVRTAVPDAGVPAPTTSTVTVNQ